MAIFLWWLNGSFINDKDNCSCFHSYYTHLSYSSLETVSWYFVSVLSFVNDFVSYLIPLRLMPSSAKGQFFKKALKTMNIVKIAYIQRYTRWLLCSIETCDYYQQEWFISRILSHIPGRVRLREKGNNYDRIMVRD